MTDIVERLRKCANEAADYIEMQRGLLREERAENERLRTALTELLADIDDPQLADISAATIVRARQANAN